MSLPLMLSGGRPWDRSLLGDGRCVTDLNDARERRLATQSVISVDHRLTIVLTRSAMDSDFRNLFPGKSLR